MTTKELADAVPIELVPINSVTRDPENARTHSARNLEAIAASLREFGQVKPVAVDSRNVIRAGSGTHEALVSLGATHIKIVRPDLTDEQWLAYAIADNRTAELAEWDDDVLRAQLESLEIGLFEAAGFDLDELSAMLEANEPEPEIIEDEVPDLPADPKSQRHDIWQLGEHRLGCGDCTDADFFEELMDGQLADLVFTDPPYNVAYVGKTADALTIDNDEMSGDDFAAFLLASFRSMVAGLRQGGAVYVCHADSEGLRFRAAFVDSGLLLKQCLVWVKNTLVLGRQDYQWKHEPILYGWKPGAAHQFLADRKQTTVIDEAEGLSIERNPEGEGFVVTACFGGRTVVLQVPEYEIAFQGDDALETIWRFDKPSRSTVHPTMKPVALVARAIRNSSAKGELVIDGFAGAGSTLIAAEQLGRRCYCMELDPVYCDVIITRWENFTGETAVLLNPPD